MFRWLRRFRKKTKFLPVGTWITCEAKNHRVCQLSRNVISGTDSSEADYMNWVQSKPMLGARFPIKCFCGSPYVKTIPLIGGVYVHTEEHGWWPDAK